MKSVMDIAKEEERREFLKLSPLERMETRPNLFLQFLSLKDRAEKVSEYEIYTRYRKDKPRHYDMVSLMELMSEEEKAKTRELAK